MRFNKEKFSYISYGRKYHLKLHYCNTCDMFQMAFNVTLCISLVTRLKWRRKSVSRIHPSMVEIRSANEKNKNDVLCSWSLTK